MLTTFAFVERFTVLQCYFSTSAYSCTLLSAMYFCFWIFRQYHLFIFYYFSFIVPNLYSCILFYFSQYLYLGLSYQFAFLIFIVQNISIYLWFSWFWQISPFTIFYMFSVFLYVSYLFHFIDFSILLCFFFLFQL